MKLGKIETADTGEIEKETTFTLPVTEYDFTWKCNLFGLGGQFIVTPEKGRVPNRFWRWMQYLCFGNEWIKEK